MPRGAAVIPYDGKRGRVWRIKFADATGKQIMETVGAERDGRADIWTVALEVRSATVTAELPL